ncbi:putative alanine racemase [Trypanosoma rangeli]|uniref:Pyridoxal phosphate homeostasis protein n=1 Tax=Trypanosoma rangeli TaxID=5698 RepID=A0A422NJG5_TRYRA|nr:putative alanine racemase [Trypanosoma rangeli]RNF05597.1 putative alanine racemase [Trypanosoma rangeli]|eukprot:RNF05597.1 putative alanine racemase [Trypanosoma rangeli]
MSRYDVAGEPTAEHIAENYKEVMERIHAASGGRSVSLVAVSKTKSPACLQALYDCGQRCFGENYVQEMVEKAGVLPKDICWHFVGHLQSNKVKELLEGVEGLCLVQTVDSAKLANKLQDGCVKYREGRPLDVYVQVNTSGEESKSGTEPGKPAVELAQHIQEKCKLLKLAGLMTIGMPDYTSRPENFECLLSTREAVAAALSVPADSLALSMGMTGDFENAIKMRSTVVRVGTALFGQRYYPKK